MPTTTNSGNEILLEAATIFAIAKGRVLGKTIDDLSLELSLTTAQISQIIHQFLTTFPLETPDELRSLINNRYEYLFRETTSIIDETYLDADGNEVKVDADTRIKAINAANRLLQAQANLNGVNSAIKIDYEFTSTQKRELLLRVTNDPTATNHAIALLESIAGVNADSRIESGDIIIESSGSSL